MYKYKANPGYKYMDVLNMGKCMPFQYTRATIPLLESIGVPNKIFLEMAEKQLRSIVRLCQDMSNFERVMNMIDDSDEKKGNFSNKEILQRLYLALGEGTFSLNSNTRYSTYPIRS
jgi:hypothetical protein